MKRLGYIVFFAIITLSLHLGAQVQQEKVEVSSMYTDRVTDQSGAPLVGITVRVRGKGQITTTNSNGEFTIRAVLGDIIVLSKNGKIIDTYRYNGSLNYEVEDDKDILGEPMLKSTSKIATRSSKRKRDEFSLQLDSAFYYSKRDPSKSIDLIRSSLTAAGENKQQLGLSYQTLGDVYMNLKQYDLAASNYKIAIDNQQNTSTQLKLAKAYLLNKQVSSSEQLYKTVLRNSALTTIQKVEIYEGLGDVYFNQQKNEQAIKEYTTALNLSKRSNNISKRTDLNSKIAATLEVLGKAEEAEEYYNRSISSAEEESPQKAALQSQKAAEFYSNTNSISKEVQQRKKTLETLENVPSDDAIIEESEKKITKPRAKLDLGNAYLKQNNVTAAIPLLTESAEEAEKSNDIETQKDAVQKLSEAYVSLGNEDQALFNYKKYVALVDKLYKQKEDEINAVVQLNRELSEKQNRISSLETDRELSESKLQLYQTENQLTVENDRRQKLIIYGLLLGLILVSFSFFWMWRSNRQKRLTNNLLALKSLRTQMNPHFIFNALNSVNSFIAQNDERTANRYLTDFSTLMRSVLVNSEEDFIPLEKELELLELYLKLEHSRFRDKFDYELTVDKKIDKGQFQIPPMLLQPYIENAVWHGLRYKKEKGLLKISLNQKDEETIEIIISDNGIGREKSKAIKTEHQKKQQSKGMQNIKQRISILNEMYKDKVDVFIQDLYDDATGTKVILTLKKD